jgi:hypothetical protein
LAARLLDQTPKIAVLCARVMVGRRGRLDPTSAVMQRSPLASDGLPGRAILGFMAGASIMRVDAFREVGGYCAQLFIGGEEQLVALDLAARGWKIVYCPALTVRHFPSASRDTRLRHQLLARNAVWVAWMRLPWAAAFRVTWTRLAARELRGARLRTIVRALAGLPWALYRRRVLPPEVENERRLVGDGSDCGRRQGDSPACPICGGVGSGLPAGLRASPRSSVAYLHGGVACAYCGRRDEPVPGMAAAFIGRYGEDS